MEVPATIELNVGERYTLRLPGLGSAGYVWEYAVTGDDKVVSIAEATAGQPAPTGGAAPAAFSADTVFTIAALEPGQVTIHFTQRRPWEKDKPPLKEALLQVHSQRQ
jgi:predicted secreted protein